MPFLLGAALAYLAVIQTLNLTALRRIDRSIRAQTDLLRKQREPLPPNDGNETTRGRAPIIPINRGVSWQGHGARFAAL